MGTETFIDGESTAEFAPQGGEVVADQQSRRRFLATLGVGTGAGMATTYAYGVDGGDTVEEMEIAADDPQFPEQESSIISGEESKDMLALAAEIAEGIERGEIEATFIQGTSEIAAVGALAFTVNQNEDERLQMGRRELIAGLLGGTILFGTGNSAEGADPIPFKTYDINSNARPKVRLSPVEIYRRHNKDGRPISLNEFMSVKEACESPRGARLFAQHQEVTRYNKVVRKRSSVKTPEKLKKSPITFMKRGTHEGFSEEYGLFRLINPVVMKNAKGESVKSFKYYGVTRHRLPDRNGMPYDMYWTGYLGTNYTLALAGMRKKLRERASFPERNATGPEEEYLEADTVHETLRALLRIERICVLREFGMYDPEFGARPKSIRNESRREELLHTTRQFGPVSLEEFSKLDLCNSPNAARLFSQHMDIQDKKQKGIRNAGESPIVMWKRSPNGLPSLAEDYTILGVDNEDSNAYHYCFRTRNPVQVDGKKKYKYYGVIRVPHLGAKSNREIPIRPHGMIWTVYLGTDKDIAEGYMEGMAKKY